MSGLDNLILPQHVKRLTAATQGGAAPGVSELDLRGKVYCPFCKSAEHGFELFTDAGRYAGKVMAALCRKCRKRFSFVAWIAKAPMED